MKNLLKIEKQIEMTKNNNSKNLEALLNDAKIIFDKQVKSNKALKKSISEIVSKAESSKDLTQTENDEYFNQWCRIDLPLEIETDFLKNIFREYMLENHFVDIDFKNECAVYSIGPAIIINDSGDILDQESGKWFISKNDYESEAERNELIKKYMEKSGYFPSIIRCDCHGNAFYVNTKENINE